MHEVEPLVDAVECVSFNIFTISLEPACIISNACSRTYVYAYTCTCAFTAAALRNGSYANA